MRKFIYFLILSSIVVCGCRRHKKTPVMAEVPPFAVATPLRPLIIIDAGHGGEHCGAAAHDLIEKELTLDLAHRLQKLLHLANFPTQLTRHDDATVTLSERSKIANRVAGAVFVSLHVNAAENPAAVGVETFWLAAEISDDERAEDAAQQYTFADNRQKLLPAAAQTRAREISAAMRQHSQQLAQLVQQNLVDALDEVDRGVKQANFAVLRGNFFGPAILTEVGFLTNEDTAELLADAAYRQKIANAIARGITTFVRE